MNLAELQRANGRFRADHPALVDERGIVSHRALDEEIRRTAALLARRGIAVGDLVGVCLRDGARTIVLWMALARLGAVFMPMDWRWTPDEQRQIAKVLRPRLVIADPDRRADSDLPIVRHDAAWGDAVAALPPEDRMARGGDMAMTMSMTSGTTGLPKGNVHTHDTYRALLASYWIDRQPAAYDRLLALLPTASAAGRYITLATLLGGGTVFFPPPLLEAAELVATVRRERINVLCIVPTILRNLLAMPNDSAPLLPELHKLISIGSMLFPEESRAVRARLAPNLINYYGSTGGGINTMLFPDEIDRKPGSVGRPVLGCDAEIVDDDDRPLPRGETGRLRVRGPQNCLGVYPPDPQDRSYFEGWHYPGDYALLDSDGYLFLQGRYNDIIISGGSNVYAPEVERVLLELPGIREVAVLGVPNPTLGEDVAAFLVADEALDDKAIIRHCRGRLAAYKVPAHLCRVPELPRNSAGKILKRTLLEIHESGG
jgi:acyl-CoA synthetase (AMP-forming)/AMP-acid ligase II